MQRWGEILSVVEFLFLCNLVFLQMSHLFYDIIKMNEISRKNAEAYE